MIQKQNVRSENVSVIEKEIDILLKLDHPNIIKLLDFKRTVNNYYLIFEFCEHGDLDNYIRNNSDNRRLPEPEVKRITN
jgi:serine/threonine-protein kinase ULK/ATG1